MKIRKIIALLPLIILIAGLPAQAKSSIPHDYIFDSQAQGNQAIPVTHEAVQVLDFIQGYLPAEGEEGKLKNPQDLFIDKNNILYIADTGNNAVLMVDGQGNLLAAITEADGIPIRYPLGVYVDEDGDIFVSDNGNARIVHLDGDGKYIESFTAPESELLSQNLSAFDPTKLAINSYNGYIYMLIGKEFLTLDAMNRFQGLVGTEPVSFSFIDYLVRTFATDLQKSKLAKREPVSYNNFCITPDNKIYAVTMAQSNQIKKINSIGDSTFPGGFYGEVTYDSAGKAVYPFFVDIAVNSYNMVTIADQHSAKLYQYNSTGELLAVFGGRGTNKGSFQTISSICYDQDDRLFVLDGTRNNIQVMAPTNFLNQLHTASALYLQGFYDESFAEWSKIKLLCSNYPVAQTSMANILFKQEKYSEALRQYYDSGNKEAYGKTIGFLRNIFYKDHFALVAIAFIGLIAGAAVLLLRLQKRSLIEETALYSHDISRRREFSALCLLGVYHPLRMLDLLKWRRARSNLIPIIALPVLLIAVRVIASYFTGFSVSLINKEDVSILYEAAMVLIPYITYGLCAYAITSVFSGEVTLYETFASLSYALVPMIVLWPVLTLVSGIVSTQEASIFHAVQILTYVWMGWIIVLAMGRLNDFTAKKTVAMCLISVLGVGIVWVLCLLVFTFSAQLMHFIAELFKEIKGRYA